MSLDTECFSMYSDMSMRTMASSLSNRKSASDLHNSVLPTPVGPRKRNEPFGLPGSDNPARARRMASAIATIASSWPTTRRRNASSICSSLSLSPCSIFATGMPVHLETTSAISFSVTLLRSSCSGSVSARPAFSSCFSRSGMMPYCSSDIRLRSPARCAASNSMRACSSFSLTSCAPCNAAFSPFQISSRSANSRSTCPISLSRSARRCFDASSVSFFRASRSIFIWMRRRSSRSIASGLESISMLMRLAASSIRSMALSGNCLSVM